MSPPASPQPLPGVNFSLEFGVRWSPQEFIEQAAKVEQLVPQELQDAIDANIHQGPVSLGQDRTETIRKWIAWANELAPKEEELKRGMSENRQTVLSSKRLLLLKCLDPGGVGP